MVHDYDDWIFTGGLLKQTRKQQLCIIGAYLADHLGGQIIIGQVKGQDRIQQRRELQEFGLGFQFSEHICGLRVGICVKVQSEQLAEHTAP